MKKQILMVAIMAALSVSAFGQGQVVLGNNNATLIRKEAGGIPAPIGSMTYQLLAGPDAGSLTPLFPTAPSNGAIPGRIANTVYFIPTAPNGQNSFFQIRAWSSAYATYEDAFAVAALGGQSVIFQSVTSFLPNPGDPPPLPVSLAGKYPGFFLYDLHLDPEIPEPSSAVLMLLSGIAFYAIARARSRKPLISAPATKSSSNN